MSLAEQVDAALGERVLVYGSLPPAGRDLDLLVREPQHRQIEELLLQLGCVRRGTVFARFAGCTAEIVELCDAARWDLREPEIEALLQQAQPIQSLRWLVRPSPHHSLLILGRRLLGEQGFLSEKLRSRVAQAIQEDPLAWERARAHAKQWRASRALEALEHAYRTGTRAPRALWVKAWQERAGQAAAHTKLRRIARLTPAGVRDAARKRRGVVISFSGLDGSGKSFQAAALRDVLQRLGHDVVVVRTRISWEEWLWAMVPRAKRLIGPAAQLLLAAQGAAQAAARPNGRGRPARDHEPALDHGRDADGRSDGSRVDDPAGRLRERSALLTDAWIVVIALANAWSQWRLMGRHLLRGEVVICDRYTLDSVVELRYKYGTNRPLKPLRLTLARLYPRPARAYFLDVEPSTAFERKGEWGIPRLSSHRALYLEEHAGMGVELLEGERPPEQICAEVAKQVWLDAIPR